MILLCTGFGPYVDAPYKTHCWCAINDDFSHTYEAPLTTVTVSVSKISHFTGCQSQLLGIVTWRGRSNRQARGSANRA